uniref:Uncharacterized protein n=1 Tax=Oryza sativa subsp. japonica TaxID=39947 RepID=Q8W5B8_ORYSJ|nr:hypothetical protein [Oryza sativa Japonica Group]
MDELKDWIWLGRQKLLEGGQDHFEWRRPRLNTYWRRIGLTACEIGWRRAGANPDATRYGGEGENNRLGGEWFELSEIALGSGLDRSARRRAAISGGGHYPGFVVVKIGWRRRSEGVERLAAPRPTRSDTTRGKVGQPGGAREGVEEAKKSTVFEWGVVP